MPDANVNDLLRFAEAWIEAGLPKKSIAPVTAALDRSLTIAAEAQGAAIEARERVAPLVASGELSFAEGVEEAARRGFYFQAISAMNSTGIGEALVVDARAVCHKEARSFLRTNAIALAAEADPKTEAIRLWLVEYGGLPPAPERFRDGVPAEGYVMD